MSDTSAVPGSTVSDADDVYFITHPDVVIDPKVPVPDWPLSERGRARMRAFTWLPLESMRDDVYGGPAPGAP